MSDIQYSKPTNPRFVDIEGQTFGRWTVIGFRGEDEVGNKQWACVCLCGVTAVVAGGRLKNGKSLSCGCLAHELAAERSTTHGAFGTPEYGAWGAMWQRTTNPKVRNHKLYACRKPPEEWRSFETFLKDMGPRPSPDHSLERVRNNEPYGPTNCVWATARTQARNTSKNLNIKFKGEVKCLQAWAEELGMDHSVLKYRITKWGIEKALTTPITRK